MAVVPGNIRKTLLMKDVYSVWKIKTTYTVQLTSDELIIFSSFFVCNFKV